MHNAFMEPDGRGKTPGSPVQHKGPMIHIIKCAALVLSNPGSARSLSPGVLYLLSTVLAVILVCFDLYRSTEQLIPQQRVRVDLCENS